MYWSPVLKTVPRKKGVVVLGLGLLICFIGSLSAQEKTLLVPPGKVDPVVTGKKMTAADPSNPVLHFSLAISLEEKKNFREAVREYQETLRLDPNFVQAYSRLGLAAGRSGQYKISRDAFLEAVQRSPKDPELWYNLGVTYGRMGSFSEAVSAYQICLALDPKYPDAEFNLKNAQKNLKKKRLPIPQNIQITPHIFKGSPGSIPGWDQRIPGTKMNFYQMLEKFKHLPFGK